MATEMEMEQIEDIDGTMVSVPKVDHMKPIGNMQDYDPMSDEDVIGLVQQRKSTAERIDYWQRKKDGKLTVEEQATEDVWADRLGRATKEQRQALEKQYNRANGTPAGFYVEGRQAWVDAQIMAGATKQFTPAQNAGYVDDDEVRQLLAEAERSEEQDKKRQAIVSAVTATLQKGGQEAWQLRNALGIKQPAQQY